MIGIPFKMICNCNNNGGSSNPNPTPKQTFSANFGFVALLSPKTPTGVIAYTQVLIKNISLDGGAKEIEIDLPYGYAGLSSIKSLYIMCDKLGVTATEDAQQFPTVHTNQTDMTKQTTLDNLIYATQAPLKYNSIGIISQGEWIFEYDGTSSGDFESKPTSIKYKFTGDTSLLYF